MTTPALENSLSLGTDVATIVKDMRACLYSMGKTVYISSHSSSGLDLSGDTGFDKYKDNSLFTYENDFFFLTMG